MAITTVSIIAQRLEMSIFKNSQLSRADDPKNKYVRTLRVLKLNLVAIVFTPDSASIATSRRSKGMVIPIINRNCTKLWISMLAVFMLDSIRIIVTVEPLHTRPTNNILI